MKAALAALDGVSEADPRLPECGGCARNPARRCSSRPALPPARRRRRARAAGRSPTRAASEVPEVRVPRVRQRRPLQELRLRLLADRRRRRAAGTRARRTPRPATPADRRCTIPAWRRGSRYRRHRRNSGRDAGVDRPLAADAEGTPVDLPLFRGDLPVLPPPRPPLPVRRATPHAGAHPPALASAHARDAAVARRRDSTTAPGAAGRSADRLRAVHRRRPVRAATRPRSAGRAPAPRRRPSIWACSPLDRRGRAVFHAAALRSDLQRPARRCPLVPLVAFFLVLERRLRRAASPAPSARRSARWPPASRSCRTGGGEMDLGAPTLRARGHRAVAAAGRARLARRARRRPARRCTTASPARA